MNIQYQKRQRKSILLVLFAFLTVSAAYNPLNSQSHKDYIEKYKDLALYNMIKFKIPPSITLAQAICESGGGQSELARKSNNQFGIKAWSSWENLVVKHDDDLKKEAFKVYPTVEDSYWDHAKFFQQKRYLPLFDLEITDYKGWAKGLKDLGYATSPQYTKKLLDKIELHNLTQYDKALSEKEQQDIIDRVSKRLPTSCILEENLSAIEVNPLNLKNQDKTWDIYLSNGEVKYINFKYLAHGVEPQTVKKTDTNKEPVKNINKDKKQEGMAAKQNKPKDEKIKNKVAPNIKHIPMHTSFVVAEKRDTFQSLSDSSGISKEQLSLFNDLPEDYSIQVGDYIYLHKKKDKADKPNYEHLVKVGESMHSISQLYGIKLESLLRLNNLNGEYIPIEGKVLRLR